MCHKPSMTPKNQSTNNEHYPQKVPNVENTLLTMWQCICSRSWGDNMTTSISAPISATMPSFFRHVRVAIVHDWLYVYAGAERVLGEMLNIFPQADLYCILDNMPESDRTFLRGRPVYTSFLQRMPLAKRYHRLYFPLMPLAIEQHDLSNYTLIISSSYSVAKGVLTGPDQLHICYCHSPMRYAWDLQHQYLGQTRAVQGARGVLARVVLHYARLWDVSSSVGVDHYVANSEFVRRRIQKLYARSATIIYPPVDVSNYSLCVDKDDFYFTAARLVPFKRIDLVVQAFARMPDRKLIVAGDGPEMKRLKAIATSNIEFLGYQSAAQLRDPMQRCRAFIFAGVDDFGITPLEAQACGTPVIAYGRGGALETITPFPHSNPTGVLFYEQTPEALATAIRQFESLDCFSPTNCRANALRFSAERFREEFSAYISAKWTGFMLDQRQPDGEMAANASPGRRSRETPSSAGAAL